MKYILKCCSLLLLMPFLLCAQVVKKANNENIELIVLGNVQDAGSPQIGCKKKCCKNLWKHPDAARKIVSLGVIDHRNKKTYLFDATPDVTTQVQILQQQAGMPLKPAPDAVFLTHAHIGHYTGLMFFGKEAMAADNLKVYAMPRMSHYLQTNGPWSQLVATKNIVLSEMVNEIPIALSHQLKVTPVTVPHRDEYSETVGFIIEGARKKALFIPDIDKWAKWSHYITEEVKKVDYAFLDATFFDAAEVVFRDISAIPHPFVVETMELFKSLPLKERNKVYFIHFNHSNKLLQPASTQSKTVLKNGFNIARMGNKFVL